jgi:thiosulfate/3-mercaptopyruvate sulfurtransferase
MDFKIGRNPLRSEDRPWAYVLVRHVPVARDTFGFYGEGLLPEFADQPTWKYATPHNIQRETPQNQSCECCHCNEDLFLMADDVAADEIAANANVIVSEIPTLPDCPRAAQAAPPPTGPGWPVVLGIGIALAGVTVTPIVIRRKEYWE